MKSLRENWKSFFGIILDPWNVILLLATGALLSASVFQGKQENAPVVYSALLNLMLTVSSVVLGARLTKQWLDQTESGILVVRGKAAIRNLKLLMHNIADLGKRVRLFMQASINQPKSLKTITLRNYEEIISKCDSLAEETVNSIENWTDIIPEADVRTQIGELTDLREHLNDKMREFRLLQKEIKETKSQSAEEKAKLKTQVEDKESEIRELRSQVLSQVAKVGSALPFGFSSFVPYKYGLTQIVDPNVKYYEPGAFSLGSQQLGSVIEDASGGLLGKTHDKEVHEGEETEE